ncbi:hypothetical protein COCNU_scaffold009206G000020 [Cocos nucifera]|nr:hypothetical protein [Cocos nucifera]
MVNYIPSLLLALLLASSNLGTCFRFTSHAETCSPSGELVGKAGNCNTENNSECCRAGQKYPQYRCSPPVTGATRARMTINSFAEGGEGGGVRVDQYFIREEIHPTVVDITIAHSSEAVEISYVAGVECEKEVAIAKLVSSLCRRVKLEGRERKPMEKRKATSYLPKTYKRARKKQQEGNTAEGSIALSTSESDADPDQFSVLEPITITLMELSQSVKKQGDSPIHSEV